MEKIRLKELRIEKGLTQAQLAKEIGVNQRTISQYENSINEPDIETIKRLSKFFEVTIGYFLGVEEQ